MSSFSNELKIYLFHKKVVLFLDPRVAGDL